MKKVCSSIAHNLDFRRNVLGEKLSSDFIKMPFTISAMAEAVIPTSVAASAAPVALSARPENPDTAAPAAPAAPPPESAPLEAGSSESAAVAAARPTTSSSGAVAAKTSTTTASSTTTTPTHSSPFVVTPVDGDMFRTIVKPSRSEKRRRRTGAGCVADPPIVFQEATGFLSNLVKYRKISPGLMPPCSPGRFRRKTSETEAPFPPLPAGGPGPVRARA
ncbi:translation initiation factor IF-2-like [Thrips palmi]|uniref:Translation initiation factor IF-2-like n=1 Tax=Thrips palmi TaxID=161013 RepID=A0A6P8YXH1_THRPL|nr:translation initiation factor IF-2-like [Thrips palmi]